MTFDDARREVESITIGWPLKALDVQLALTRSSYRGEHRLIIAWRAPHRDTGQVGEPLVFDTMLDELELRHSDAARLRSRVHDMLRMALMHELAESFLVNGVRVLDPHATPAERAALERASVNRESERRAYRSEADAKRELFGAMLRGEAARLGDARAAEVLDAMRDDEERT